MYPTLSTITRRRPARPTHLRAQRTLTPGGLGRLRQRPLPLNHSQTELPTAFQTERRVSVQIHPVSSLVRLRCLAALSLQGGPDGPTYSGTTLNHLDGWRRSDLSGAQPAGSDVAGCERALRGAEYVHVSESAERAVGREQLGVGSLLDDVAAVEHDDLVGSACGRQAVGDDDRRSSV